MGCVACLATGAAETFAVAAAVAPASTEAETEAEDEVAGAGSWRERYPVRDAERFDALWRQCAGDSAWPVADSLLYVVRPVDGRPILPDSDLPADCLGGALAVVAAPGEYEPASFVLVPRRELKGVRVTVSDLEGPGGIIPALACDIKHVVCWFQGESAWRDITPVRPGRVLTPELLLNDPSLVRADRATRRNFVRLEGREDEMEISQDRMATWSRFNLHIPNADFPFRDAPAPVPADLPAHENRQFWLTVHVPDDARPGFYQGRVELAAADGTSGVIPVRLRVLPFRLAAPGVRRDPELPFTISIYHPTMISTGAGAITPHQRSMAQFRAELANLRAHGVDNPLVASPAFRRDFSPAESGRFRERLLAVLAARAAAGMATRPVYFATPEPNLLTFSVDGIAKMRENARFFIDIVEEAHGHRDVYFYGRDEAEDAALSAQRPMWEALHAENAKVLAAGYRAGGGKTGSHPLVGDLLDLTICAGRPDPAEAALWHADGKAIWNYGNPQGGAENPEAYRRNYGFVLDRADYDGVATYAYYDAYGHPWNDFDHHQWRDHNLVYPTVDGVVDTIAWEGFREAGDDLRYLATFRRAIRDAADRALAEAAEAWFAAVDPERRDLDAIRFEMIDWILRLRGDSLPDSLPGDAS